MVTFWCLLVLVISTEFSVYFWVVVLYGVFSCVLVVSNILFLAEERITLEEWRDSRICNDITCQVSPSILHLCLRYFFQLIKRA